MALAWRGWSSPSGAHGQPLSSTTRAAPRRRPHTPDASDDVTRSVLRRPYRVCAFVPSRAGLPRLGRTTRLFPSLHSPVVRAPCLAPSLLVEVHQRSGDHAVAGYGIGHRVQARHTERVQRAAPLEPIPGESGNRSSPRCSMWHPLLRKVIDARQVARVDGKRCRRVS